MDDASQVRRAAREAVRDVTPDRFREAIEVVTENGSVAPGVLVVLSARAVAESVEFETVAERAAGVQLIYDGLGVTRALAHDAPWEDGERGDIDALVADVLVARGFYLLARTEAAGSAVETVRNFGRDQTRQSADAGSDVRLEADVFRLAAVAGMTAVGTHPPAAYRECVADLARSVDGELPAADTLFDTTVRESLRARAGPPLNQPDAGVRPSPTDS